MVTQVVVQEGNLKRRGNPMAWTLLGGAIGLALLYAATRQVDFAALVTTLKTVRWSLAFGVLGATVSFVAIKTWRWAVLLRFVPGIRFRELHSSVYVGLAVNYLVAHVGEFLRAGLVARQHRASVSAIFATVLVERVLDFIALLTLLAVVSATAPSLPDFVQLAAAIAGAFVVIAIAGLYLTLHPPGRLQRVMATLSRPLPERLREGFVHQLGRSRAGLSAINDLRLMMLAILVSVLQWSFIVVAIWCSALAVGESPSLVATMATFVLVILGLTLPSSPMQLGTTQLAFAVGLETGGIDATTSIAASLVYTVFLIIPVMLVGGILILRGRLAAKARLR